MRTFTITFLISILFISLTACEEDPEEKENSALDLAHFPGDQTERLFRYNSNDGFYITLPECFNVARYRQISITNEENYRCNQTQSYFSIDRFTPEDVEYYEKYFAADSTGKVNQTDLLLKYVLNSRMSNLEVSTSSIFTTIKSNNGVPITLAAVKGHETDYSNPLYYQYAVFKSNDDIYVLQFIINEGDISFFHEDLIKMFKSIRKF